MIIQLSDIPHLSLITKTWDRWFFYGDLGAGKTTLIRAIIQKNFWWKDDVVSPTYTYYKSYWNWVFHFDCYRLGSYDDFVNIGGEEIFDDAHTIIFAEWPELIVPHYKATKIVNLSYYAENARVLTVFDVASGEFLIS